MRFSYKLEKILENTSSEVAAYNIFKSIYFKNYIDWDFKTNLYYKVVLGRFLNDIDWVNLFKMHKGDLFYILCSFGLMQYKLNDYCGIDDYCISDIKEHTNKFQYNIIKAINKQDFNTNELLEGIQGDFYDDNIPWGRGSLSILAIDVLFINPLEDKVFTELLEVLKYIYNYWKIKDRDNIVDLDFPIYKYLLEDITSIVYKNFLGKGEDVHNLLNKTQRKLLEFINQELNTHTYSMLYAGLKPQGIDDSIIFNIGKPVVH